MSRLTIMPIFAHPDDESFAGTGSLIKYIRAGVRAVLVCATRGERGKPGEPPLCTPEELPAYREQEMRAAAAVLGIDDVRFLGYRDKELPDANVDEAVGRIVRIIREVRPQVLYTFPPDGHSGHPDHVAINKLVGLAFRAAGDAAAYPDAGPAWQPAYLFWHIREGMTPERAHAEIAAPGVVDTVVAALKSHRSQHLSIERVFRNYDLAFMKEWFEHDRWHLAGAAVPRPAGMMDDLFEGVR